jgi:hypothetical protein
LAHWTLGQQVRDRRKGQQFVLVIEITQPAGVKN